MKKWLILIIILVLIVLIIIYFSKSNKPEQVSKPSNMTVSGNIVIVKNFSFDPQILKIKKGEKVVWKNNDSAPHSIVGNIFQSDILNKGNEFNFIFPQIGEYDYNCGVHPSMKGKIIIE